MPSEYKVIKRDDVRVFFARGPVTSISKSHVLNALMRFAILIPGFLFIDIWLLILCDTCIYAIIIYKLKLFSVYDVSHTLASVCEPLMRSQ